MHDPDFIGDYQLCDSLTSNDNIYSDCEVFEAKNRKTNREVILKISRDKKRGKRELEVHSALSHEFIVNLLESFTTKSLRNVLIFEKYPRNLQELYSDETLESNRIQKFMKQLMMGIEYIHGMNFIHRDIKPDNLMLNENDCIKIGDFGLARVYDPDIEMTQEAVSLWYRPIEILLDSQNHTKSVDIWSAGCVMAELYRRCPLFQGEGQLSMINKIISVLGKPTLEEWPTLNELPAMRNVELNGPSITRFEDAIPNASKSSLDLIRNMIKYDPERRLSASQVLKHEYFKNDDISAKNNYEPEFP
ncbi:unnamed protein product [Caenorhabditis brenneri]